MLVASFRSNLAQSPRSLWRTRSRDATASTCSIGRIAQQTGLQSVKKPNFPKRFW
jgi:hypothetical protein